MGLFSGIGRGLKAMVNVPKWMGVERLSQDASYIASVSKSLFHYKKAVNKESFE